MAWQAILQNVVITKRSCDVSIVYMDGTDQFAKAYTLVNVDDEIITRLARDQVAVLQKMASSIGKVTIGIGQSIDLNPIPPTTIPPTQETLDQQQFVVEVRRLQQLRFAVDLGVMGLSDKRVIDQQALLASIWKDTYVELL